MEEKKNGHANKIYAVFATPTLTHTVSVEFMISVMTADQMMGGHPDITRGYQFVGGDQFVWKARNRLVADAFKNHPDFTDLFMIDDDVGFPPQKIIEFLMRPEPVLAGCYPKKNWHDEYPADLAVDDAGRMIERAGSYKALTAPGGFLRIKRHVLETIMKTAKTYQEPDSEGNWHERHMIFEVGLLDGQVVTEDAVFCHKWRALGGEVWVDPAIQFSHRGTALWHGNLSDKITEYLAKSPEKAPLGDANGGIREVPDVDVAPERPEVGTGGDRPAQHEGFV